MAFWTSLGFSSMEVRLAHCLGLVEVGEFLDVKFWTARLWSCRFERVVLCEDELFDIEGEFAEICAAFFSDNIVVFEADAALAVVVSTGFNGDDLAGFEGGEVDAGLAEAGEFVDLEADAVAEAVTEFFTEALIGEVVAGGVIDGLAGHAGFDGLDGDFVRFLDGGVEGFPGFGGFVDDDDAGEVGVIVAGSGTPIEQDGVGFLYFSISGHVVASGGVGASGADDALVEGLAVGSSVAHAEFEFGGELVFGATDEEVFAFGEEVEEAEFGEFDRSFGEGDFVVVFHGSELLAGGSNGLEVVLAEGFSDFSIAGNGEG